MTNLLVQMPDVFGHAYHGLSVVTVIIAVLVVLNLFGYFFSLSKASSKAKWLAPVLDLALFAAWQVGTFMFLRGVAGVDHPNRVAVDFVIIAIVVPSIAMIAKWRELLRGRFASAQWLQLLTWGISLTLLLLLSIATHA